MTSSFCIDISDVSATPFFPSGEDVAFYFGWMNFYATYIIIPALVGVAMYMFRPGNVTVDTDPYLPFFSVFMAIWAVLFVVVSVNVFLGLDYSLLALLVLCIAVNAN